jgi:hypothetical protein
MSGATIRSTPDMSTRDTVCARVESGERRPNPGDVVIHDERRCRQARLSAQALAGDDGDDNI